MSPLCPARTCCSAAAIASHRPGPDFAAIADIARRRRQEAADGAQAFSLRSIYPIRTFDAPKLMIGTVIINSDRDYGEYQQGGDVYNINYRVHGEARVGISSVARPSGRAPFRV